MRPIIRIFADAIRHTDQRYPSCGDWIWENGDLKVKVSELSDPRYELLIAYHELTEALILRHQGIAEEDVTAFDMAYEECRRLKLLAPCGCIPSPEPGNDEHAPYRDAHRLASANEMRLAMMLDVDWWKYAKEVDSL